MKINRRIVLVLIAIAFVIGIVEGFLPLFGLYVMDVMGGSVIDFSRYQFYLSIIRYGLNPIVLFTVSYILGRAIDVKAELRTTIISVYLGCFVGDFLGYLLSYSYMMNLMRSGLPMSYIVPWSAFYGMVSAVILFFVSFAAIFIASKRNIRAKAQNTSDMMEGPLANKSWEYRGLNRKHAIIVIAVIAAVVLFPTPRFVQHPNVLDCNRTLAASQSIQLDWTEYLGNVWNVQADITSTGNVTVLVVVTNIGHSQNTTKTFVNKTRSGFGFGLSYGSDTVTNFLVTVSNPSPLTPVVMNGNVSAFRNAVPPTLLPWWMQ